MIDCVALREDIEKVKLASDKLSSSVDKVRESGQGLMEASRLAKMFETTEAETLNKYLDKFVEENEELFLTQYEMSEGVPDMDGTADSAIPLPDGRSLVFLRNDGSTETRIFDPKSMTLSKDAGEFSDVLNSTNFSGFCKLSDSEVIVCDNRKEVRSIDLEAGVKTGAWPIDLSGAKCAVKISNDEVLIGGVLFVNDGALEILNINTGEKNKCFTIGNPVTELMPASNHEVVMSTRKMSGLLNTNTMDWKHIKLEPWSRGGDVTVSATEPLDDRTALISVRGGTISLGVMDLDTGEITNTLELSNDQINCMERLSDEEILLGGQSGAVYVYYIKTGKLKNTPVGFLYGRSNKPDAVKFISRISENEFLFGGGTGGWIDDRNPGDLRVLKTKTTERNLAGLRKVLPEIAAKGIYNIW